ncbi:MAG: 3D domain-containing protein [Candidatus Margulisiibacteriota bacterium]
MRATIIIIGLLLTGLLFAPSSAKIAEEHAVLYAGEVMATAYNSLPSQTDSTPWITAAGTRCREGVIASNFLPLGTKVKIEGYGNRVFTVEDRMNKRYAKRIDIWFRHYNDAKQFGVRKIKYYVLASV